MSKYLKKISSLNEYTDIISGSEYDKNTIIYNSTSKKLDFNEDDDDLIVVYNFTEDDVTNNGSKTLWTTHNSSGCFNGVLLNDVEVDYNSPKTVEEVGIGIHILKIKLKIDSGGYMSSNNAPLFYNQLFIDVHIPNKLKQIPMNMFLNTYFNRLVFPKNLEQINPGAFAMNNVINMSSSPYIIDTLELPSTLIYLNSGTLPTVKNLIINSTEFLCSGGLQNAMSFKNEIKTLKIPNLTNIPSTFCSNCTSLTSINIPNSVTNIDSYAFSGCTSLTSINIPNSVTNIDSYAFSGCTSLEEVRILNPTCNITNNVFKSANINCKLYLGDELVDITQYMNE